MRATQHAATPRPAAFRGARDDGRATRGPPRGQRLNTLSIMSLADLMGEDFDDEDDSDDDEDFDPTKPEPVEENDDAKTTVQHVHADGSNRFSLVRNSSTACFGVPYIEDDSDDEIDEETDTFKPKEISDERLFSEEKYFSPRLLELLKGSVKGGDLTSPTGLLTGVYPMLLHQTQSPHPERPARIVAIYNEIISLGLDARCKLVPARPANKSDIALVHTANHAAKSTFTYPSDEAATETLGLDGDTYFSGGASGYAAMLSAGSIVELTTRVCTGELRNAMAVCRPPGHHCEQNQAMGFCLINNVCVAAAVARQQLGISRVLIVDWDVHHGNGIQHIFDDDPNVLYISLHRYGNGFYPGTGHPAEVGKGEGLGKTVNLAFTNEGYGDREYLHAFHRLLMPIAREYAPELVLISAGFDAALGDPLGGMVISPAGYAQMTAQLQTLAGGKVVVALEGGYDLKAISHSAVSCLQTLLGEPCPMIKPGPPNQLALADIEAGYALLRPYWKCLQPPIVRSDDGPSYRSLGASAVIQKKKKIKRHRGPWWYKFI